MTDTDRDLAVIADYMRRRGAVPLPDGLMAAARERALRQAPERDTARASLVAFWTRGPVAIAGALGALATVAVLLVVLSGLPLGGTDAPAADPSLDGQPLSSPAASTGSTVVCGRIEADACQTAIDLVRDGHPREVAEASAIVVDDTCPPDATCDREYAFELAVVLVPAEDVLRDVVALRVFGAAGPDQAGVWSGALPQHVIRLIPGAQAPVPAGTPAACPEALIEGTLVADERWGMALAGTDGLRRKVLWPHGYTARREAGGLVLYDVGGSVVAREGDVVSIGGGETGSDGPWLACGDITAMDSGHESLLRGLRAAGLDAHVGSRFGAGPFPGSGVALCVSGESLQVYEFRTEAQAHAAVTSIDPDDPSHVGDSIIEWVGTPKFWQGDRSIVLYAGSDPDTEDALDALLGEPFAAGGGRGGFPEERDC